MAKALRTDEAESALCRGAIDANLTIVGRPSPVVREQQGACVINIVALDGPAINKLAHDHPYYQHHTIGGDAHGVMPRCRRSAFARPW